MTERADIQPSPIDLARQEFEQALYVTYDASRAQSVLLHLQSLYLNSDRHTLSDVFGYLVKLAGDAATVARVNQDQGNQDRFTDLKFGFQSAFDRLQSNPTPQQSVGSMTGAKR